MYRVLCSVLASTYMYKYSARNYHITPWQFTGGDLIGMKSLYEIQLRNDNPANSFIGVTRMYLR